ncbi:hypothetical protein [Tsuneonella sp. HG222]
MNLEHPPQPHSGDMAQIRLLGEQIADAAIVRFNAQNPPGPAKSDLHPLVKWLVGAIAGFGSAALIGLGFWLVTSVSQMQVTLARMDERQVAQGPQQAARFTEIERRVTQLEGYHRSGGR